MRRRHSEGLESDRARRSGRWVPRGPRRLAFLTALIAGVSLACVSFAAAAPVSALWRMNPSLFRVGGDVASPLSSGLRSSAAEGAVSRGVFAPPLAAPSLSGATGQISGKVEEATGVKAAIDGIEVCAYGSEESVPPACERTGPAGEYTLSAVEPGNYVVEFGVPFGSMLNYITQYYNHQGSEAKAELVKVAAGEHILGINAALSPGAEITGTVTSFDHGGIAEVGVCALPTSAEVSSHCTTTQPGGGYHLTSLSTGNYSVSFFTSGGEYMPRSFNVSVVAGNTSEIDPTLSQEVPHSVSAPATSGIPVEGQTLTVVHGSWTNSPTSYQDEWGRCTTSELSSCHTVAFGERFALSVADVGYAVRVREYAANTGGKGGPAYSAPTGPIAALPKPQPPPASGVLGATTTSLTAAQLKALLVSLLAPTGKNAKVAALLKNGGYLDSFNAPSAGQLVISWYLVPKGAHLATTRPVLVAVGRFSFTQAGVAKLPIKLTAKGKSLLKHAKQLKLTAKGVLTLGGQKAVSATKSFTLKR